MSSPIVQTDTRPGGPLQTKYYCKLDKSSMNMNVVMELTPTTQQSTQRLPLRYVLLIDVSDSMNEKIGKQNISLLRRVQMFAELATRKIDENDWLSIVTFSDDAQVDFPMQRMIPQNKQIARAQIQNLCTRAYTNLESGFIKALEVIDSAPKLHRPCRDCIILFTDGIANLGETDPKRLIGKYRKAQKKMNRTSCIPVSALTIGGYRPELLIEISRKLGSESFYWLNDEEDFEVDMFVPLFLKEQTTISDVNVKISANANCYFKPVNVQAKYLTDISVSKVKIRHKAKTKKIKAPTTESFFIHSLPDEKNLAFNLQVSDLRDLHNERVVDVTIQYLDCDLQAQVIRENISLSTASLKTSLAQDPNASNITISDEDRLLEFSAYITFNNYTGISWMNAQDAIVKVAHEKYKSVCATYIGQAKDQVGENPQHLFQQACIELNEIRFAATSILPQGSALAAGVMTSHMQWTERITRAQEMVKLTDNRNFPILACMESSIESESPIGVGVFKGEQPFLSTSMKAKLEEEKENLRCIRRLHVGGGNIDINVVKNAASNAITRGDLEKMRSCYEDLKALKLFGSVDERYLRYVGDEINQRQQLEKAKRELEKAASMEDLASVSQQLAKLGELRQNRHLTFHAGDEEMMKRGKAAVEMMQTKHSMRGEIAKQLSILKLPSTMTSITAKTAAIEILIRLKKNSVNHEGVFTHQQDLELNESIAKHQRYVSRMKELKNQIDHIVPILRFPRRPVNYEAINMATAQMKNIKIEADQQYEGLLTESDEDALKYAIESSDILTDEKRAITKRLDELLPILELPIIPRNYASLKEAVDEVSILKQRAMGFKDVFTADREMIFTRASANLATLMTKREDIIVTINLHIANAALPKLASNYQKLKDSIESLTVAKQEANGFVDVFTKEHEHILYHGTESLKILQAERDEIEKDVTECVPQLQLPMIADNFNQISKGVDTMNRIEPELKGFGMYKEEYGGLMSQATFNRDVLNEKKQQILNYIQVLKVDLKVSLTPENLPTLSVALEKMKLLKKEAEGYGNVFTSANESDLYQATNDLEQLRKQTDKTAKARYRLEEAIESRNFARLTHALDKASKAPFIKNEELIEARKLAAFLDAENRCAALESAIDEEDIELIEEALLDMKEANVTNDALQDTANRELHRLRKDKRRKERQRRREERAAAKRKRALDKLNESLDNAMVARDLDLLQKAVNNLDVSDFKDEEVEAALAARELLKELQIERMRERLNDGIEKRDVETLYNALMDAKYGGYEEHMQEEYSEAEAMLVHLLEMLRLRQEISKMSRATISEVHSYNYPPVIVKKVMKAFFTILGEDPRELTWVKIQNLMGRLDRYSMTKRVKRFRIEHLTPEGAEKSGKLLKGLEIDDVEPVSNVAATLFAWAKFVVKEVEHVEEQRQKRERKSAENERLENQYEEEEFEDDANGDSDGSKPESVPSESGIHRQNSADSNLANNSAA